MIIKGSADIIVSIGSIIVNVAPSNAVVIAALRDRVLQPCNTLT